MSGVLEAHVGDVACSDVPPREGGQGVTPHGVREESVRNLEMIAGDAAFAS